MSHIDELEAKIQKHDIAINKLSIEIDNIRRHNEELFSELNVTSHQVSAFMANQDHFTEQDWLHLSNEKRQMEEKLNKELSNIQNPSKLKKTYSELHAQPHWLFIR